MTVFMDKRGKLSPTHFLLLSLIIHRSGQVNYSISGLDCTIIRAEREYREDMESIGWATVIQETTVIHEATVI